MNSPRQHTVRWNGRAATMAVTDPNDWIERHWTEGRFYEPATLAVVERYAAAFKATGRPSLFVDIGAHRGNHTVFALAVAGFDYGCAFEPDYVNAEAFWKNVELNDLEDRQWLSMYACGLGEGVTRVWLRRPVDGNTGATKLGEVVLPEDRPRSIWPDRHRVGDFPDQALVLGPGSWLRKIEQVRLERRVPPRNVLIKCDVEGMESQLVPMLCERFDVPVIAGDPVKADGVRCIEVLQHGHGVYMATAAYQTA